MRERRYAWIDIAKAIAILCMIIGHVYPVDHPMRRFIFSFHMPIFFILSGYTVRTCRSWRELAGRMRREAVRLLVPCGITTLLYMLQRYMATLLGMNDEGLLELFEGMPAKLLWASGVDMPHVQAIGAVWFLVALFWVRTLYSAIQLLFPGPYVGAVYLFMLLAGYGFGRSCWLPQSMDVAFVALFYFWLGSYMPEIWKRAKKYWLPLVCGAFALWLACIEKGIYVELAAREYDGFALTLFGAVAGSACVMSLAKAMEGSFLSKPLSCLGRHTLAILCVHKLDVYAGWGGVIRKPLCLDFLHPNCA